MYASYVLPVCRRLSFVDFQCLCRSLDRSSSRVRTVRTQGGEDGLDFRPASSFRPDLRPVFRPPTSDPPHSTFRIPHPTLRPPTLRPPTADRPTLRPTTHIYFAIWTPLPSAWIPCGAAWPLFTAKAQTKRPSGNGRSSVLSDG